MPKQNGNPKILAAGAAVQLLTGIPAAWGVFQKPVMAGYGFSRGQAMLSFCHSGGRVWHRLRHRRFCAGSARPALCGPVGYRAAGRRQHGGGAVPQGNAALFFLVYSIPAGVGSAFLPRRCWPARPKVVCQPQKGLATGVSGAAMGLSGAFLTVFVGFVENRWGMRVCFAALGVVVLAVCGASPPCLEIAGPAGQRNAKAANDLPPHQMVRTTQYRLCVAGVALAAPPMLLFSPEILTIAADRGLPKSVAPLCVAVGSAASAAGRLLCPAASDHWGRKPVLYGVYAALAAGSIGFAFAQGWWVLAAYCVLTCFLLGGAAVQPALNTDLFGLAHAGVNYGFIALGMSAGSLLSLCGQPAAGPACPAYAGGSQRCGGRDMFPICKTCQQRLKSSRGTGKIIQYSYPHAAKPAGKRPGGNLNHAF